MTMGVLVNAIGRLGKDPKVFSNNDEKRVVASVSIAVNERMLKDTHTEWLDLTFFYPLSLIVEKYCRKGQEVAIVGRLRQETYKDKDGNDQRSTKVYVDKLQLLGSKDGSKSSSSSSSSKSKAPEMNDDEDVPF